MTAASPAIYIHRKARFADVSSFGVAGFPLATFRLSGDPMMLALATVRANSDDAGRCRVSQRRLAAQAGMSLSTFNGAIQKWRALGVLIVVQHNRRRPAETIIRREHLR